jgi:hypothetical protein
MRLGAGARVVVLALLVTVSLAGAGRPALGAGRHAAFAASAVSNCPNVLFLGARGSGEDGPGTPGWKPAKTPGDPHGLGAEVNDAYQLLRSDLPADRVVDVRSVQYAANNVSRILEGDPWNYFQHLAQGVSWTLSTLKKQAAACPGQEIVLAGYSQGAMVMHRVLRQLQTWPQVRDRVVSAVLIGDGDQLPYDNDVTRIGSASLAAHGIGLQFPAISRTSRAKFSKGLGIDVLSVCNHHDVVCDYTHISPGNVDIHLGYVASKLLPLAADRATRDVRAVPLPTPDAVHLAANQGVEFNYQLTADTDPGYALKWAVVSPGAMPVGLTLDGQGLITGTPGKLGSVTLQVQVSAMRAGKASRWVRATIVFSVGTFAAAWSAATTPAPAGAVGGSGVDWNSAACASASRCVAVGVGYPGPTDQTQAVIVTGSGSSWQAVNTPLPAGVTGVTHSDLVSVSCAPDGRCAAVGTYSTNAGQHGLLVISSGSAWTAYEAPLPANARPGGGDSLVSVTCPAPGECVAVGNYLTSAESPAGLLLEESGAVWRALQAPSPANVDTGSAADTRLSAVACLVATHCTAAGSYVNSSAQQQLLMLSESGGVWTATGVTPPADAYTGLGSPNPLDPVALACSPAACTVTGEYATISGNPSTYSIFVMTVVGGSWKATTAPVPPGLSSYTPASIACRPAMTQCNIAGYYFDETGTLTSGSGTTWAALLPPTPISNPTSQSSMLFSISCPPGPACLAVGDYGSDRTRGRGFLVSGAGTSWASSLAPLPAGGDNAGLTTAACASAAYCVAFGDFSLTDEVLIESGPA